MPRGDPARGLKRGDPEGAYPAHKRVERQFNKKAKVKKWEEKKKACSTR